MQMEKIGLVLGSPSAEIRNDQRAFMKVRLRSLVQLVYKLLANMIYALQRQDQRMIGRLVQSIHTFLCYCWQDHKLAGRLSEQHA